MPQKPITNLKHFVINPETPLGEIDTSHITTMADLFSESQRTNEQFEGISSWDVSQVKDMRKMFDNAESFNQAINSWDVSRVENMSRMFEDAKSFTNL